MCRVDANYVYSSVIMAPCQCMHKAMHANYSQKIETFLGFFNFQFILCTTELYQLHITYLFPWQDGLCRYIQLNVFFYFKRDYDVLSFSFM